MRILNRFKSDAALLQSYQNGDASAFNELYGRYKDRLFNYLYQQSGYSQMAEEIAQDVWMGIVQGAERFELKSENGSFSSWLFSIAYRRCADFWRKYYAAKNVEFAGDNEEFDNDLIPAEQTWSTFDSEQEQDQYIAEVRAKIARLPDEQRQCFILYEEGFSYQEISEITESGQETVKSRLRYARNHLREILSNGPVEYSEAKK